MPTAALLFCLISPLEPEDTEDVLLTVAERLRTAGALAPLCCSPGGLQEKKEHRYQNHGEKTPEALSVHKHTHSEMSGSLVLS